MSLKFSCHLVINKSLIQKIEYTFLQLQLQLRLHKRLFLCIDSINNYSLVFSRMLIDAVMQRLLWLLLGTCFNIHTKNISICLWAFLFQTFTHSPSPAKVKVSWRSTRLYLDLYLDLHREFFKNWNMAQLFHFGIFFPLTLLTLAWPELHSSGFDGGKDVRGRHPPTSQMRILLAESQVWSRGSAGL